MRVFFIPSWYPTQKRPTWCNWMRAHLKMTKISVDETIMLQVNIETDVEDDRIEEIESNHFYSDLYIKKHTFSRTYLFYNNILKKYEKRLETMFNIAVEKYGKPDVIHAHVSMPAGYGASIIGQKYNIPVVVTEHYSGFFSDNKYPWRLGFLYKQMRNRIDGFYAVSPGFKDKIYKRTGLTVTDCLPNPINIDLFKINNTESKQDVVRLVSTGDIGITKGTDILLEAVNKLPEDVNWELLIIGKNNPFPAIDDLKKLPIIKRRVTFIERVSQEELCSIYNNSDIYIVSSRIETANVSMLEAMACGCFVVSNSIGAPETLLDNSVSEIFDNTADRLAEALLKATKRKEMHARTEMSNFVQKNYSFEVLSEKLKDIYKSLIREYDENNTNSWGQA